MYVYVYTPDFFAGVFRFVINEVLGSRKIMTDLIHTHTHTHTHYVCIVPGLIVMGGAVDEGELRPCTLG